MVEPEDGTLALAAELAARGTDASPLEAVLEPAPPPPAPREVARDASDDLDTADGGASEASAGPDSGGVVPPPGGDAAETLYELLGVSPQASRDQIEKAHRFCLDMYKDGALATYSLLEAGDAELARRRISLAYETLSDQGRRHAYDLSLGLTPSVAPEMPFTLARAPGGPAAPVPPPGAPLPDGPLTGAELKRIRESRGIALREVAASTKIGLRFLEYIEEDRFAQLPPAVYLRGFLNEYARVLGLDVRRATEAYMSRLPPRE